MTENKKDKTDDSMEIDLSWFKNIFKKKSHLDKEEIEEAQEEEDEITESTTKEIKDENSEEESEAEQATESIPEKELRNEKELKHEKESKHKKEQHRDIKKHETEKKIELDFKSVWKKTKETWNNLNKYKIVLLILIPLLISLYLRITPWYMPITDSWADGSLKGQIKSMVTQEIIKKYPTLQQTQREPIIEEQYQKVLNEHKAEIDSQIKAQSEAFRSRYRTKDGTHMLLDIDSYAYYRETKNYVDYGHLGNSLKNGEPWDTFPMAPIGIPPGDNLHIHFSAMVYKIVNAINSNVNLMTVMFFLPMIIAVLACIPAFFIGRKFGGDFGGFFSAVLIAIHPAYIARTSAGVPDTDFYSLFFPLMIMWLLIETFDLPTLKKRVWAAVGTGLMITLYAWAWSGWWHLFDLAIAAIVLDTGIRFVINRYHNKPVWHIIKDHLIILGTLILSTLVFVTLLRSPEWILWPILQPLTFINIQQASYTSYWPNVYTTVAELNPMSLDGIIGSMGGGVFMIVAIVGILMTAFKKGQHDQYEFKYFMLLGLWFAAAIFASTKGVRFLALLALPFSIAIGAFAGQTYYGLSAWLKRNMNIPGFVSKIVLAGLLIMIIMPYFWGNAKASATQNIPLISDAWWDSLTEIRDNTQPNAIITSWWDFGHWFKAVAERPVTFDGGTQTTPMAHWVGKILLTGDEDEAMGILRMLDCGSNNAFEEIQKQKIETIAGVDLLYRIIKMEKEDARAELIKNNVSKSDDVLQYTHCTPPEAILVTSEDMVGKAGVWGHFGSWNFTRARIYTETKTLSRSQAVDSMKGMGIEQKTAEQLYSEIKSLNDDRAINTWISPWPGFGGAFGCNVNKEMAQCGNGLEINMTTHEPTLVKDLSPIRSLVYINEKDEFQTKRFEKYSSDIDVVLIPPYKGSFQAIMAQHPLGESIFARMFYLEGEGLTHFTELGDRRSVLNERIVTWKVNWDGTANNTRLAPLVKNTEEPIIKEQANKTSVKKTKPPNDKKNTSSVTKNESEQ